MSRARRKSGSAVVTHIGNNCRAGLLPIAIGRSYWTSAGLTDRLRASPPFKPCVRIFRTRLTKWTSGRGMHYPWIPNRAAQADESQGLEERTPPSPRSTSRQSGPRMLENKPRSRPTT